MTPKQINNGWQINLFQTKKLFLPHDFRPTSVVLAARFEVVRGPQFKLII